MAMKKPADLTKLLYSLETYYSSTRTKMQVADDLVNQKFRNLPRLPEGVSIHKSSTARNLIDTLSDQIRTDQPEVKFLARGSTQKALQHRDLMEQWGLHVLKEIDRHSQVPPGGQATRDMLSLGASCIKYVTDLDALPDAPIRAQFSSLKEYNRALRAWKVDRAEVWPFIVKPIDPRRVYPAPGSTLPPIYIVETQKRRTADMWLSYPDWSDPKSTKQNREDPMREVLWVEYWDKEHYIVEVDGERIIDKENPYGAIPYAFQYSRLGRFNHDGDPAYLAENILDAVVGELEAEVRVKTAMDAQWQFHVFPRLLTTEDARKARRQFMKGPGGVITVTSMAEAPKWMESPQPNQQMMMFLGEIKDAINRRFPRALNERPAGVDAAIHQALLVGQAIKPLQPVKAALSALLSDVLNGLARQARVLEIDTTIFGKGETGEKHKLVKSEDFTQFNFEVKLEAADPTEDDRKMLVGLALLRLPGVMSRQTFREQFARRIMPDNAEEEERILTEQAVDQLIASGALMQAILEAWQMMGQEEQMGETIGGLRERAAEGAAGFVPGARERLIEQVSGAGPTSARPTQTAGLKQGGV